jgi:prepilin signal peptidase PulO-like enzyme (type II secretory pathway)
LLKWGVIGGVIPFVGLLALSRLTRGGLGMGDVKLFGALGFLVGLYATISTLFLALLICVAASFVLLIAKKRGLKDKLPFAPFILAGFTAAMILSAY